MFKLGQSGLTPFFFIWLVSVTFGVEHHISEILDTITRSVVERLLWGLMEIGAHVV